MRSPDVTFEDEEGVDAGGPTLEFFWLALQQIKKGDGHNINLFEGDSGLFYVFGKVAAHSILHGGSGFPSLSLALGEPDSASSLVSVDNIPDFEYKDIIEKVV